MKKIVASFALCGMTLLGYAQEKESKKEQDSILVHDYQERKEPLKLLHAEPLYIDLIRDLGARKGEKEWNFGFGLSDNLTFDTYEALVEYEWAPIDRLGLEIELPFLIFAPQAETPRDSIPGSRMESLKLGSQWTFMVNEKMKTSMALGYINELEFSNFNSFGNPLFTGNTYNPFLIAAKRWGDNYHTLIYTGPRIHQHFKDQSWDFAYEMNTSFHYMIPGTSNFIGVEFNKQWSDGDFDMTIRPQMRVGIAENLLIGIVGGIPVNRENERLSSFVRLIWEPSDH